MKTAAALFCLACAVALTASAAPRNSLSYGVSVETADGGGGRSTSANYSNLSTIGGVAGLSSAPVPANTLKHGYAGQIFDVNSLALSATPPLVAETATTQLSGLATLDDATLTQLLGTDLKWTVLSGPIVGVTTAGLATAGIVPTNQSASIQGSCLGANGVLNLIVVDSDPDNFGAYAGDGLPDFWQIQYFGLNNSNAAPNADPDHDGRNNRMEFLEGTDPTDPASAFFLRIAAVLGQPAKKNLIFGPRVAGRDYTLQFKTPLPGAPFAALLDGAVSDNGSQRTVTDLHATGPSKFYRVSIALSAPALQSPGRNGSLFTFQLPTLAGFNYLVEYKTSLPDPAWTPLQWVLGNGQLQTITDPLPPSSTRFYRVHRSDP